MDKESWSYKYKASARLVETYDVPLKIGNSYVLENLDGTVQARMLVVSGNEKDGYKLRALDAWRVV